SALFVPTMTAVAALDEVAPNALRFSAVAMMGAASSIGLGLAISQTNRDVIVIDGDGSLLMELGSLSTVAEANPVNFVHIVINNKVWFHATGNYHIPGAHKTKWAELASASGYPHSYT